MGNYSGKILGVMDQTSYFFDNIKLNFSPLVFLDILIVAVILYWVYIFLRETRAMRILYGLILIVILVALGQLLDLILLNWILKSVMAMIIVAIPVVFQPELRTALEKLGRPNFFRSSMFAKQNSSSLINELISAINVLASQKTGALIILQRQTGLREYIDNGIAVDAAVSAEILLSIFFPKSPLHDGAVIIVDNRIVSAGSVLPVSGANIDSNLGTRHRAGLGITENSDAVSIIVSEETGRVSLAVSGRLETRIDEERLKNRLSALLRQTNKKK